ncbi:MAG: hypothetical protein ACLUUO_06355 [Sellimonas intestinalis]
MASDPEIVRRGYESAGSCWRGFGHTCEYTELLLGGASIDVHGVPLTDETVAEAKAVRRGSDGIHRRRRKDITMV